MAPFTLSHTFFPLSVFVHPCSSRFLPQPKKTSNVCLCLYPVTDCLPTVCRGCPCCLHSACWDNHPPVTVKRTQSKNSLLILVSGCMYRCVFAIGGSCVSKVDVYFPAAEEGLTTGRLTLEARSEKKSEHREWTEGDFTHGYLFMDGLFCSLLYYCLIQQHLDRRQPSAALHH